MATPEPYGHVAAVAGASQGAERVGAGGDDGSAGVATALLTL